MFHLVEKYWSTLENLLIYSSLAVQAFMVNVRKTKNIMVYIYIVQFQEISIHLKEISRNCKV